MFELFNNMINSIKDFLHLDSLDINTMQFIALNIALIVAIAIGIPLGIALIMEARKRRLEIKMMSYELPTEQKQKLKKYRTKLDVREVLVFVRNGDIIEKIKAYLSEHGEILDKKGKRLWKIEPQDLKLYIFKEKKSAKPLLILDGNTQAIYHFEDPPPPKAEDKETKKKLKVMAATLNPSTLFSYIASQSIKRLLGKITISTGEKVLYIIFGAFLMYLMEFFILPLIGFHVSIGPVR